MGIELNSTSIPICTFVKMKVVCDIPQDKVMCNEVIIIHAAVYGLRHSFLEFIFFWSDLCK